MLESLQEFMKTSDTRYKIHWKFGRDQKFEIAKNDISPLIKISIKNMYNLYWKYFMSKSIFEHHAIGEETQLWHCQCTLKS
jgi:hypothetical protein